VVEPPAIDVSDYVPAPALVAEPAVVVEPATVAPPVIDEPVAIEEPAFAAPAFVEPPFEEPTFEEPTFEEPTFEEPTHGDTLIDDAVAEAPAEDAALEDASEEPAEPTQAKAARSKKSGDEPPVRLTFRPRTRARTAVGIGTMLAAAASVLGCYVAARERDTPSIGIAITLWVLTAIIWAVHSGTSVTRLSVRGGQLQVVKQGVRTTIDLTSSYTPVEVHGRPGRHGWKVVFRRRDLSTFVIDQSMVDPSEFMRVLRYYRPGVDSEAT
jgi:hypothetical protein